MPGPLHRGDGGQTQLASGQRVSKGDPRIECLGSVDELSSVLGLARAVFAAGQPEPRRPEASRLVAWLARIQHELYLLGADLARRDGDGAAEARIAGAQVAALDAEIAEVDAALPKLRVFILPGGGVAASQLHVARAVCRRVERQVVGLAVVEPAAAQAVPYLNRLSLALFSMARLAALLSGEPEMTA